MHIAPRKVFPCTNCILAESFDGTELGYSSIRIFKAVNEIDKVHMGVYDHLINKKNYKRGQNLGEIAFLPGGNASGCWERGLC
jgi:hypothetical protein